jgi:hypothetical protein
VTAQKAPLITPARVIAAVCVIVPFIAVLWVPIYNRDTPELAGFPFYFWWQLLWVAITAALMGLAYFVVRREELARKAVGVSSGGVSPNAGTVTAAVEDEGDTYKEAGE